jgi:hypothetical protein
LAFSYFSAALCVFFAVLCVSGFKSLTHVAAEMQNPKPQRTAEEAQRAAEKCRKVFNGSSSCTSLFILAL